MIAMDVDYAYATFPATFISHYVIITQLATYTESKII